MQYGVQSRARRLPRGLPLPRSPVSSRFPIPRTRRHDSSAPRRGLVLPDSHPKIDCAETPTSFAYTRRLILSFFRCFVTHAGENRIFLRSLMPERIPAIPDPKRKVFLIRTYTFGSSSRAAKSRNSSWLSPIWRTYACVKPASYGIVGDVLVEVLSRADAEEQAAGQHARARRRGLRDVVPSKPGTSLPG